MLALIRSFVLCILLFDSLLFIQSDFGMDVTASSRELVVVPPRTRSSAAVRRTSRLSGVVRRVVRASPSVVSESSGNRVRSVRSRNDSKLINWMRQTIIRLETEIKKKQAIIDELHARPAPSTEREMYLLSEIEMIGRQFESEYSTLFFLCPRCSLSKYLTMLLYSQLLALIGRQKTGGWRNVLPRRRRAIPLVRSISGLIFPKPRFWLECWTECGVLPCC